MDKKSYSLCFVWSIALLFAFISISTFPACTKKTVNKGKRIEIPELDASIEITGWLVREPLKDSEDPKIAALAKRLQSDGFSKSLYVPARESDSYEYPENAFEQMKLITLDIRAKKSFRTLPPFASIDDCVDTKEPQWSRNFEVVEAPASQTINGISVMQWTTKYSRLFPGVNSLNIVRISMAAFSDETCFSFRAESPADRIETAKKQIHQLFESLQPNSE